MTPKILDDLAVTRVNQLWEAVTVLEAQETLNGFRVTVYPQMKDKAQRAEHKRLYQAAYPAELYPVKKRATSIKELGSKLNGAKRK